MPEPVDGNLLGFQLWINLPAAEKMRKPRYQEYASDDVPDFRFDTGATGRLIAGKLDSISGAVRKSLTDPLYLDLKLPAGGSTTVPVPTGYNALIYVYAGDAVVAGAEGIRPVRLSNGAVGVLGDGSGVQFRSSTGAALLLMAARPLKEPVARHGPFVMNDSARTRTSLCRLSKWHILMTTPANQSGRCAMMAPKTVLTAKLGAVSYAIWALLHLQAAWAVYQLGQRVDPSMTQARLFQDAWNLACFSVAGLGTALTLNWRNDRWGYWINLAVISVADIGFIIFVLLPGYLRHGQGCLGRSSG